MIFFQKLNAGLSLMRPANMITAVSDVWAGAAIAGYFGKTLPWGFDAVPLLFLSLATLGLYAGGVVFNDVFDAELDRTERPERAIPSGKISLESAAILGTGLLVAGVIAGGAVSFRCGFLSLLIAASALLYDKFTKPHPVFGPLNMGICRGLNLLLGMSILPLGPASWWFLTLVPVAYIAAITVISRGEVYGGGERNLSFGAALYAAVIFSILIFAGWSGHLISVLPFLVFFAALIFPPLIKAIRDPSGPRIGRAVKAGVLALITMNAAWAAASSSVWIALIILLLLPCSLLLARMFAVT